MNIEREVERMQFMSVNELREKFCEVFNEPTSARNKAWLIKRIAWRMQANVEGGLSERARRRALEIANEADLRMMPPREPKPHASKPVVHTVVTPVASKPSRNLVPGQSLQRVYKGRNIVVTVLDHGFQWQGEKYKSLTAVAKAVTGKHWNGFNFFRVAGDKT